MWSSVTFLVNRDGPPSKCRRAFLNFVLKLKVSSCLSHRYVVVHWRSFCFIDELKRLFEKSTSEPWLLLFSSNKDDELAWRIGRSGRSDASLWIRWSFIWSLAMVPLVRRLGKHQLLILRRRRLVVSEAGCHFNVTGEAKPTPTHIALRLYERTSVWPSDGQTDFLEQ